MNQDNVIEQYLQQLCNMGLTEDMIEMYRKQMSQYNEIANNWTSQLSAFNSNIQQLNHFFSGDHNVQQNVPVQPAIKLNHDSALTDEEKWVIACGADIAFANEEYLDDITTGMGQAENRQGLSEWWDIDSPEELVDMINWLREEGHRFQYDTVWQAIKTVSVKESKAFLREYVITNQLQESVIIGHLRNMRDTLELFHENNLIDEYTEPEMLIWDYARIINLARAGYDAGYISGDEALEIIMSCKAPIKSTYNSWKHLSLSYQFARCIWNGVDKDAFEKLQKGMQLLLTNEDSPWVRFSW